MLIVVNAIFSMFSFCKLLYLNMFRRGAREAARVLLVFPQIAQICTDAVRGGLIPQIAPGAADATDAVRVLLVFPQIAQICTDAVRGAACFPADCADLHRCRSGASCFPTDCADLHRCRSGRFLFSTQIAPLAPRSKREFCYNVTCYMLQ